MGPHRIEEIRGMNHDSLADYPFPSARRVVLSTRGMVATSQNVPCLFYDRKSSLVPSCGLERRSACVRGRIAFMKWIGCENERIPSRRSDLRFWSSDPASFAHEYQV